MRYEAQELPTLLVSNKGFFDKLDQNILNLRKEMFELTSNKNIISGDGAESMQNYINEIHGSVLYAWTLFISVFINTAARYLQGFNTTVDDDKCAIYETDYIEDISTEIVSTKNDILSLHKKVKQTVDEYSSYFDYVVTDNNLISGMEESESVLKNNCQSIYDFDSNNQSTFTECREILEGIKKACTETVIGLNGTTGEFDYVKGSFSAAEWYQLIKIKNAEKDGYQISSGPIPPKWDKTIYDHDYDYDPNMEATQEDHDNWKKWGENNFGASLPPWLRHVGDFFGAVPEEYKNKLDVDFSDATATYAHYRGNTGEDLTIDLKKAYNDDVGIKMNIDNEILRTQQNVEALRAKSQLNNFNVSGGLHPTINYPEYGYPSVTENWQKALGGFNTWSYSEVKYENGEYQIKITVNSLDRYNFDKGKSDLGSGTPDDVNGRFEALGWAKSFDTKGQMTFEVKWKEGEINDSIPTIFVEEGR